MRLLQERDEVWKAKEKKHVVCRWSREVRMAATAEVQ